MPENTRVAVISIVVENPECVTAINGILHDYSDYIIGHQHYQRRDRRGTRRNQQGVGQARQDRRRDRQDRLLKEVKLYEL